MLSKKEDVIENLYSSTGYLTYEMLWRTNIRLLLGWCSEENLDKFFATSKELAEALHVPWKDLAESTARAVHAEVLSE